MGPLAETDESKTNTIKTATNRIRPTEKGRDRRDSHSARSQRDTFPARGPTINHPTNSFTAHNDTNHSKHVPTSECNIFMNRLKIWYTNADTLSQQKLNKLASRVHVEHPDIICVTEVHPKNSVYETTDELLTLDGYNLLRNPSGRGIAIYTATHLMATKIETSTPFEESLRCNIGWGLCG